MTKGVGEAGEVPGCSKKTYHTDLVVTWHTKDAGLFDRNLVFKTSMVSLMLGILLAC